MGQGVIYGAGRDLWGLMCPLQLPLLIEPHQEKGTGVGVQGGNLWGRGAICGAEADLWGRGGCVGPGGRPIDPMGPQVVLLSATMPLDVLEVTKKFMREPIRILVKKEELTLEGIRQFYINVEREVGRRPQMGPPQIGTPPPKWGPPTKWDPPPKNERPPPK